MFNNSSCSLGRGGWLRWPVRIIAERLTWLHHEMIRRIIAPKECIAFLHKHRSSYGTNPGESDTEIPVDSMHMQLSKCLLVSVRSKEWIESELKDLTEEGKKRDVFMRFIQLARFCLQLKNFDGVFAIMEGLESVLGSSTFRFMYNSGDAGLSLPGGSASDEDDDDNLDGGSGGEGSGSNGQDKLLRLIDPNKNYMNYRSLLRGSSLPLVPYLREISKRIKALEDVSNGYANYYVNFEKHTDLASVITDLQKYQKVHYSNLSITPEGIEQSTIDILYYLKTIMKI